MAAPSDTTALDSLHIRLGLDQDPHRMATAIVAAMTDHAQTVQRVPTPCTLAGPTSAACISLLKGTVGKTVGRGHTSTVHLSHEDPNFVIKQVKVEHEADFRKELHRVTRLPPLSVINTIYAADGPRALMPRLWSAPRPLTGDTVQRLKFDIAAALQMLHSAQIVHGDVHADNIMVRHQPASFVLNDYGGCSGEAIYPLSNGYGAKGYGGDLHRPPTLEDPPAPVRTAHGDFYRLSQTILKQFLSDEEPTKRRKGSGVNDGVSRGIPSHMKRELQLWLERDQWPQPIYPNSPFPAGSWTDSAFNPAVTVHAGLWRANGELRTDTATFARSDDKFGNNNGSLVPEKSDPSDLTPGLGSWEKSAVWAKFYLSTELRTCGRHLRYVYQEIFPWESYSNQDGYLVLDKPPPPPPTKPIEPKEEAVHRLHLPPLLRTVPPWKLSQREPPRAATELPGIWGEPPARPAEDQNPSQTISAQRQPPPQPMPATFDPPESAPPFNIVMKEAQVYDPNARFRAMAASGGSDVPFDTKGHMLQSGDAFVARDLARTPKPGSRKNTIEDWSRSLHTAADLLRGVAGDMQAYPDRFLEECPFPRPPPP
ncbi:unnamed protein product [Symbiodinium sp. CCMP2592]|nr:unnamed protein product [Symbiodinium sp. CCMP2592]